MLKDIKELTKEEGEEILAFVYPDKIKDNWMRKFSDNYAGIEYHNGQDNCFLYFYNTKSILWLHKHGYDITNLLEEIKHFSEVINDFDDMAYCVFELSLGDKMFKENVKQNWTLEYVKQKCARVYKEYYLKEY